MELLPPVQFSRDFVALSFGVVFHLFGADRVIAQQRERAADDHQHGDDEHALAQSGAVALALINDSRFGILREDVPLHGQAVKADHAVEFRHHEEDERVEHAVVVRMHADQVRIEHARVREHAHKMREDEEEEEESRHELHHPKRRVGMVKHLAVRTDVAELLPGRREAAKGAEHMDDDAKEDEAHKEDMEPKMLFAVDEIPTGKSDQIPEDVLAKLNRARERHVAEEEDPEDQAGDGLADIKPRRARAAAQVLEADAPNIVGCARGVSVLFRIKHVSPREEKVECALMRTGKKSFG